MEKRFTQCNETGKLERILVKRPQEAFQTQFLIDTNWKAAGWSEAPEFNAATHEHFRFMRFLQAQGVVVNYHDDEWIISMDSLFIRDTCIMTPAGVIQGSLHAAHRIPEPESVSNYIDQLGSPTIGTIQAPDRLSGSDVLWVDKDTLIVAQSPMTNDGAIAQLRKIFDEHKELKDVKFVHVNLVKAESSSVRDSLRNAMSPIRDKVLLVAPHKFETEDLDKLKQLGFTLEEVSEEEYNNLGASVLIVNNFAACIPANDSLKRIKESLLEEKYKYKVYPIDFTHLARGGMGIGSTIVTLKRAQN